MRRWFLSYHSPDQALAERLKAAIERRDEGSSVFLAYKSLRAGGYWQQALADEITQANAFILLVGPSGIGAWQVPEYNEAQDRSVKDHAFPVILVLLEGQTAPGLPFLRQFNWIITADPTCEQDLGRLMDATSGASFPPGELWRHTAPYRGLSAMTEADSDYFFGRERETVETLNALAAARDRLPILLGNSGVGKSSLAQAGVLAALKRQAWPERARPPGVWPVAFNDSRRWCFLKLSPGTEPIRSLVEPFLRTWQFDPTDPRLETRQAEWIENLIAGRNTLKGLLDATAGRLLELDQPKPPAFLLYIDQGEELYVRSEEHQRRRFSEILAQALGDPRLRVFMSIRSDFLGALQNDEPLFNARRQIDVPPLREAALQEVVSRPAMLLGARFEAENLAADIARRSAEEAAKDAGALPLLSYLLDDMWTQMVARGDRTLRLPPAAMELGGVLAERANAFLATHPASEGALKRVLTLRLATVREDGEPTRRRAFRSEFSDAEWRLVSELGRSPKPPAGNGDAGRRRNLRGGGARGDLPALGQAARVDRGRARVPGLEKRARNGAPRLAGNAGRFEERRAADGRGADAGAKLARQAQLKTCPPSTGSSLIRARSARPRPEPGHGARRRSFTYCWSGSSLGLIGVINQALYQGADALVHDRAALQGREFRALCAQARGRAGAEAGGCFQGMRQGLPRDGRRPGRRVHDGIARDRKGPLSTMKARSAWSRSPSRLPCPSSK